MRRILPLFFLMACKIDIKKEKAHVASHLLTECRELCDGQGLDWMGVTSVEQVKGAEFVCICEQRK